MIYKTLKVGDHIKCNSTDEAIDLAYILENDGFNCTLNTREDGAPEVYISGVKTDKF